MHPPLKLVGIRKSFGGVPVLKGVDLDVAAGEVHAVLGENGAGKSTLMKIIMGAYHFDEGEYLLDGKSVRFSSPARAQEHRVSMAYQEFSLVNSLTVIENLYLGRFPKRHGLIDWGSAKTAARALLARLGSQVDPEALVGNLKVAEQQEVEIARALSYDPLILVMDEPSSALSRVEVERLYEVVNRLKEDGVSIIYISHKIEEVFALADRITILRDGNKVGTWRTEELDMATVIEHITGKSLKRELEARLSTADAGGSHPVLADPLLQVTDLTASGWFDGVNFAVPRGKVVGVAGVIGAGKSELAKALVGALGGAAVTGEVKLRGKDVDIRRLDPSAAKDLGIALVTEDRQAEGIVAEHTVSKNMVLPALGRVSSFSMILRSKVRSLVADTIAQVRLRPPDPDKLVKFLSGGNQQKVVIGKWLAADVDLLILDEPTRGIDVGAREEIYTLMRSQAAERGKGILVFSSDLREILLVSDEILIMVAGKITKQVDPHSVTEADLLELVTVNSARKSRDKRVLQ